MMSLLWSYGLLFDFVGIDPYNANEDIKYTLNLEQCNA